MVAVREERLPDDLVGDVRAVGVGRVDVVDAQIDRGPQHLDRGGAVARRPEDARAGELHRAVADPVEVEVPDPVRAGLGGGWADGGHEYPFGLGRIYSPTQHATGGPRRAEPGLARTRT